MKKIDMVALAISKGVAHANMSMTVKELEALINPDTVVSNATIILNLVKGVSYVTSAVKQLTQLRGSKYDTAWTGLKANGVKADYVSIRAAVDAIDFTALGLDNKGLGGLKSRITMGISRAAGLYKIVGTKLSKVEVKDRNACFEVKPAKEYKFDRDELNNAMLALFQ